MKALIYEGPRQMQIREAERPVPGEDEVLIRVAYSGICGSELSGYLGHNALRQPPLIFGHEFAGTIEAIGYRAARQSPLSAGQRVTANPLVTCGLCSYCLAGRQQLCTSRKLLSAALPGSNAEWVKLPARFVYPLPDHVSFKQGALAEPLACGVRAAELAAPRPGDRALVFGLGPIGLFVIQALQVYGVKTIYAVDLHKERLEMAEELGAKPIDPTVSDVAAEVRAGGALGVEIAVDAVGSGITRRQCAELTAPGGKVVFTGLHEAESALPVNVMIRNEITGFGSFAYSANNFETALRLLAEGKAGFPEEWLTEAPLEEGAVWYERLLGNPGKIAKVLLQP